MEPETGQVENEAPQRFCHYILQEGILMAETGEPKKGWRERHKAHFADDFKEKREAKIREHKVGEPKPETVAKVQQVLLVGGIIITILGVLGFLLLYAC